MRLSIITGCAGNNPITLQWFKETIASTLTKPEVIVVANGCTMAEVQELREELGRREGREYRLAHRRILEYPDPLGSTRALNLGARHATGDIFAFLHNDLMMREDGWDAKLVSFFEVYKNGLGVVGFHGAKQLGSPALYRDPYHLTQLGRALTASNLEDAESHGARVTIPLRVLVVDGMGICMYREVFERLGGFDERYLHHMYDNDICVTAHYAGLQNYMLPLVARHVSGQTANFDRYGATVAHRGGDGDVHRESHELFYEKWRGRLPLRVP